MFKIFRNKYSVRALLAGAILIPALILGSATAAEKKSMDDVPYKLVVHVTQYDEKIFKQVLNLANNVPKQVGVDNIKIEIVAQGPGLKILEKGSPETVRIASLAPYGNVIFSACGATIKGIKKNKGKDVVLLPEARIVEGGVLRVMDLQKEGYAYIRP